MNSLMLRPTCALLCLWPALTSTASPAPVEKWALEWGRAWSVNGNFAKGRDMSAAAGFGPDRALSASDETRGAQRISLNPGTQTLTVHELLPLLEGKGPELDLEGAAASAGERAYFLVGSQALSRQKGTFERDRGWLFRLPVDESDNPLPKEVTKADLRAVLSADGELAPYLNQPAEENGLDIEGLAERDGTLFLGLRAPVRDNQATVLAVDSKALFAGTATLQHHRLPLGPKRGVRDLVALDGNAGFLVLAGPSGGDGGAAAKSLNPYELWHWGGPGSPATRLGALGPAASAEEAKAEAILLFAQSPDGIEGLIFHDGPKNGAPHSFRLSPPPAR